MGQTISFSNNPELEIENREKLFAWEIVSRVDFPGISMLPQQAKALCLHVFFAVCQMHSENVCSIDEKEAESKEMMEFRFIFIGKTCISGARSPDRGKHLYTSVLRHY